LRIRSTKPEFWRSERIARVDWEARLVLKGLESYVDDNGVGRDDMALIVGDLFQRDLVREPSRTLARVSESLSALNREGLLWRYEFEGTDLLYMSFWDSVQRIDKPNPGRFPRPDGTLGYKDSVIRESVATPRETSRNLAPVTGEQGNRGTGEQGNRGMALIEPVSFEEFYEVWPRKVKKPDAKRAWDKAIRRADPALILARATEYANHPYRTAKQFVPYPASWLNGDCWDDPMPEPPEGTGDVFSKRSQTALSTVAHYAQQESNQLGIDQ